MTDGPVQDRRTTDDEGRPLRDLPPGVVIREVPTHVDERGTVHELLDVRWPEVGGGAGVASARWRTLPAGTTTQRPPVAERVALLFGEVELIFGDGQRRVTLSHFHRCLVVLPDGLARSWRVLGAEDAVLVEFPVVAASAS